MELETALEIAANQLRNQSARFYVGVVRYWIDGQPYSARKVRKSSANS
jgi:hypothetical protein